MKDCCNNNQDRSEKPSFKKWLNYTIYTIITVILIWALVNQVIDNSNKQKDEVQSTIK